MKKDNFRWLLQIQFFNNGDLHCLRTWDINEPYKQLIKCQEDAKALIDGTVKKARIVDKTNNHIIDLK